MSADADIPASVDLFGKSVEDLQENIEIDEETGKITGTLAYIDDYTGFSGSVELQSGLYLAMHFESPTADKITIQIIGGTDQPKALDSDGLAVFRITSTEEKLKIVATLNNDDATKTVKEYILTDLVLEPNA